MQILNTLKKKPENVCWRIGNKHKKERHANFLKKLAFLNG